jgi:hypothetical protein
MIKTGNNRRKVGRNKKEKDDNSNEMMHKMKKNESLIASEC